MGPEQLVHSGISGPFAALKRSSTFDWSSPKVANVLQFRRRFAWPVRLAVAAGWQTECPAKCIELFQLAGLRIRGRLGFAGDVIGLRLFALGFLNSGLPDDGRRGLLRPSITDCRSIDSGLVNNRLSVNDRWCNHRRRRSR